MAQKRRKHVGPDRASEVRKRGPRWLWWAGGVLLAVLLVIGWTTLNPPEAAAPRIASADEIQRITAAEAKALLDRGEALIYDTRSAEAYPTKHIPQARSLPEGDVTKLANTLSKDKALIFYCT